MKARAIITKPDVQWEARTAAYPITNLCNVVHGVVGWCDAWDLVHDILDRTGTYFFGANGFEVTFEVVA